MKNEFLRTAVLIGKEGVEKLQSSSVIIFGTGGVGGYAVEALVRSGLGNITLVDNDVISETDINRQIIATTKNIGQFKVDVLKERILEINPDVSVQTYKTFFLPENSSEFDFSKYDYVIDATDTVKAKIEAVVRADALNVPVICAMGAGNKLDASEFEVSDIYKTSVCPLARVMRTELKKRKIKHLKVVYSKEKPLKPDLEIFKEQNETSKKRQIPGSFAPAPAVMGMIIAGEVLKDLILKTDTKINK